MLLGFCNEFLKLGFSQDYFCMNHAPERPYYTNDKRTRNRRPDFSKKKKTRSHVEQVWLHDLRNVE